MSLTGPFLFVDLGEGIFMQRINGIFVLSSLSLLVGCVTARDGGDGATRAAIQVKGIVEYLCEGLCTHKTATGSIQRVAVTFRSQDQHLAWKGLQGLCFEIQSIGVSRSDKNAPEPLIVPETTVVQGSKEYGFRLATEERDCKKRLVSLVPGQ